MMPAELTLHGSQQFFIALLSFCAVFLFFIANQSTPTDLASPPFRNRTNHDDGLISRKTLSEGRPQDSIMRCRFQYSIANITEAEWGKGEMPRRVDQQPPPSGAHHRWVKFGVAPRSLGLVLGPWLCVEEAAPACNRLVLYSREKVPANLNQVSGMGGCV